VSQHAHKLTDDETDIECHKEVVTVCLEQTGQDVTDLSVGQFQR